MSKNMTQSTSSTKLKTLQGIFNPPKITYRRDFVRENKLNLKELQKGNERKPNKQQGITNQEKSHVKRQSSAVSVGTNHQPTAADTKSTTGSIKSVRSTNKPTRCATCINSQELLHKQVQTEDIQDEDFLYDALKKCTSGEVADRACKINMENNNLASSEDTDSHSLHSGRHLLQCNSDDNAQFNETEHNVEDVDRQLDQLSVHSQEDIHQLYVRPPVQADAISVRSRTSQHSRQLGSREDVALPRYLEREKREKAESFMREMARDPKCPYGHMLISEEQRQSQVAHIQRRYDTLITELNHMPMTTETLRTRTRKAEIDKELSAIEQELRTYSKSAVYVPIKNNED